MDSDLVEIGKYLIKFTPKDCMLTISIKNCRNYMHILTNVVKTLNGLKKVLSLRECILPLGLLKLYMLWLYKVSLLLITNREVYPNYL
jgi:hypothetical protein